MTWNGDCKVESCKREAVDSSGYCRKHKTKGENMIWPHKKRPELLPKTLAARAEKVPAEKVEAEVLRIVQAAPAVPTPWAGAQQVQTPWFSPLEPGTLIPSPVWDQAAAAYQQAERQQRRAMLRSTVFGSF